MGMSAILTIAASFRELRRTSPGKSWPIRRRTSPVGNRRAGTDGAWVYVPEWKGFLLYGGSSPTYSNEGWFFDPDKKEWTLLWPHDALARERARPSRGACCSARHRLVARSARSRAHARHRL